MGFTTLSSLSILSYLILSLLWYLSLHRPLDCTPAARRAAGWQRRGCTASWVPLPRGHHCRERAMPSMDAWFDETVDSSLRAGTVAAARVVPKHKANSPSTCLSPSACRQLMHVQADVKAGDARGSLASSRSILNEGARGGRGRGRGKGQWGGGRGKGRGKGRGRLGRPKVTVQEPGGEVDYSSTPMQKRSRDPPRELPIVPIGQNANTTLLRSLCPNQHYPSCFQDVSPPPPCAARGQHEGTASDLSWLTCRGAAWMRAGAAQKVRGAHGLPQGRLLRANRDDRRHLSRLQGARPPHSRRSPRSRRSHWWLVDEATELRGRRTRGGRAGRHAACPRWASGGGSRRPAARAASRVARAAPQLR